MKINKDLKIPLNGGLDGCLVFDKDDFYIGTIQTVDGEGERIVIQATVNRVLDKGRVYDLGSVTCISQGDVIELNRQEFDAYNTQVVELIAAIETYTARAENLEGDAQAQVLALADEAQRALDELIPVELDTVTVNTYAEILEYVKPGKLTVAGNQWLKEQTLSSGFIINSLLN